MASKLFGTIGVIVLASGCHVVRQIDSTRPGAIQRIRHPEGATARRPAIVLADDGSLHLVEPLDCPTDEIVPEQTTTEIHTEPNLALVVVGVVATVVGGVMLTRAGFSSAPASNPYTYAGTASLVVGLPAAIGPFLGTRTELRAGAAAAPLRRPGPSEACGDRPLAARAATLMVHGLEVQGSVDDAGRFSVSPYQLVDAYQPTAQPLDISAVVDATAGARTISTVIDGGALVAHAPAFLAHADFDATIEPLRMVPRVSGGTPRVNFTGDLAIEIAVPIKNEGPGDVYALRGYITASQPALDGRIIYFGRIARGASIVRTLTIPVSRASADLLHGGTLDLSVELHDAHATVSSTPLRFHGPIR